VHGQVEDGRVGGVLPQVWGENLVELQLGDGLIRAQVHPAQVLPPRPEGDEVLLPGVLLAGRVDRLRPVTAAPDGLQVEWLRGAALRGGERRAGVLLPGGIAWAGRGGAGDGELRPRPVAPYGDPHVDGGAVRDGQRGEEVDVRERHRAAGAGGGPGDLQIPGAGDDGVPALDAVLVQQPQLGGVVVTAVDRLVGRALLAHAQQRVAGRLADERRGLGKPAPRRRAGGHADALPHAPVDGHGASGAPGRAVVGESVEEGVGRGVVYLPRGPQDGAGG
jgi:hypothetical protein